MSVARHRSPSTFSSLAAAPAGRLVDALASVRRALAALLAEARRERNRHADRRALDRLPDAILKDIGLGRSEIPYAVRSPAFERERALLRARRRAHAAPPEAPRETKETPCP